MRCFRQIYVVTTIFTISLSCSLAAESGELLDHGLFPQTTSGADSPRWQVVSREMYGGGSAGVEWRANDQRLACFNEISNGRVLDTETWQTVELLPLRGSAGVKLEEHSPNGRWVATADQTNRLHFKASDGELLATVSLPFPSRVEWSPDSKRLAAIENYRRVSTWLPDGEKDLELGEMPALVSTMAWSLNGRKLAVSSRDGTVYIWTLPQIPSKARPNALHEHPDQQAPQLSSKHVTIKTGDGPPTIQWASDDVLATRLPGAPIQLWTAAGDKLHTIQRDRLYRFQWSSDGKVLAIQYDKKLELCTSDGLTVTKSIKMPGDYGGFAWSRHGQRLAILSIEMNLFVWEVDESGEPVKVASGRGDNLSTIFTRPAQWTPDGTQLTSGSRDAAIRIWNSDGSPAASWPTPGRWAAVVSLQPSGKRLASYSWPDQKTRFWKLDGTELPSDSNSDAHMGMTWSPDGKRFAAATQQNGMIRFFDSSGGLLHSTGHESKRYLDSVAWSPDGKWLATASSTELPPTIRLWRGDNSPPKILKGSTEAIVAIAWHPDSKRITTISKDKGEIRHWGIDGRMGEPIAAYGSGGGVQWSPDGQYLAAFSGGQGRVYSSQDQEIAVLPGGNSFVRHFVWNPNSKWLAIQVFDGIAVYDLKGTLVNKLSGTRLASETMAWSPEGTKLACATIYNTLVLWDAKRGQTDWVGLPLADAKMATVTARGELLTDDREAFDKEYVFMLEEPDGRVWSHNSKEFEKAIAKQKR